MIDAHRPDDFHSCRRIYNFMQNKVNIPVLIGLTHADCEGAWDAEDIAMAIGLRNPAKRPPIQVVNPGDPRSVADSLICLVKQLSPLAI